MKKNKKRVNRNRKNKNYKSNTTNVFLSQYGLLIILLILSIGVYAYTFDAKLDLNGDNFHYINYAESITKGKGYSSPYTSSYRPTNHHPIGYSMILASVMILFGKNIIIMKIVNGLFFIGSIFILFFVAKNITNNPLFSFSISVLILLNSGLLKLSTILMTEMPYIFFTMLAFYAITKISDKEEKYFWRSKYFYIIVISTVVTYYLRGVGLGLFGAYIAYCVLSKKWRMLGGYVFLYSLLYLPYIIRNRIHGARSNVIPAILAVNPRRPEEGGLSSIDLWLDKISINFYEAVVSGYREVLFPFINMSPESSVILIYIIGISLFCISLFGAYRIGKYRYFFIMYFLANIVILLIWHIDNGARYTWPMTPMITFTFFFGIYEIIKLCVKNKQAVIIKLYPYCIILIGLFFIPKVIERNKIASADYPAAYKNYFEIARLIKNNTNKETMVASRKPGIFHYYSGTYVTKYEWTLNNRYLLRRLIDYKVDYVVFAQLGYSSTYRYLLPTIQKYPELFPVVHHIKNPDTYLLKFDIEKAKDKLKNPSK